jgi:hypothetical protein
MKFENYQLVCIVILTKMLFLTVFLCNAMMAFAISLIEILFLSQILFKPYKERIRTLSKEVFQSDSKLYSKYEMPYWKDNKILFTPLELEDRLKVISYSKSLNAEEVDEILLFLTTHDKAGRLIFKGIGVIIMLNACFAKDFQNLRFLLELELK